MIINQIRVKLSNNKLIKSNQVKVMLSMEVCLYVKKHASTIINHMEV